MNTNAPGGAPSCVFTHPFPSHPILLGSQSKWWAQCMLCGDRDHKPLSDAGTEHLTPAATADIRFSCEGKRWMPQSYSKDWGLWFSGCLSLLMLLTQINFWPLLSLMLVRPYMSVKSEGFTSAINLCDESSGLVSIWFHIYMILSRVGQPAKTWGSFLQRNKEIWKSRFISYATLINCPFVLSLLHFYCTCRQTPPLAGRKKKLPAVHMEEMPFSSVAVQIIGFSFQWLKGKIENTFWFGSPPKGEYSFSSLISFCKHSMRLSGSRLFTAFHDLKKYEKRKEKAN